jgi:hypothetical protein
VAQNPPEAHGSTPDVHTGISNDIADDLREIVIWWRERREALKGDPNPQKELEHKTFHVEKQWIAAIQRMSDLEQITITEVVNWAFRDFSTRKYT